MECAFCKSFRSKVADAYGEEAREVGVGNAGGGTVPVYKGRVCDLIGEGRRAGWLELAVDGQGREGF